MTHVTLVPLSSWPDIPDYVLERVDHYMRSKVVPGSEVELRSPLFKGMSGDEVLAKWIKVATPLDKLAPTLAEMEESNRAKLGPRSVALPWSQRKDSVYDYFLDRGGRALTVPSVDSTRGGWMRPLDVNETISEMVLSTSSGLPFYGRSKLEVLDVTVQNLRSLLEAQHPCMLFTRTQEANKTRNVFGFPFALTIEEQRYFRVLLRWRKTLIWRAALLGPDAVEAGITRLLESAAANHDTVVSIDFSSFDSSVAPRLSRPVLDHLLGYFQDVEGVDYLKDRFVNVGLVTPDGVLVGEHGVPSGSSFTLEVNSEVQWWTALSSGVIRWAQIQGDDGVYSCSDPEKLKSTFESYGLEVNREKSSEALDHAVYLQCYFGPEYRSHNVVHGVYCASRAINRILHLERWPGEGGEQDGELSGDDFFAIRSISILENCKHHPDFESLVHFVAKGDRNQLRFSRYGLHEYVRRHVDRGAKATTHRHGDWMTRAGIESWETMRVLRKLWG